jgi:hypothetical protein
MKLKSLWPVGAPRLVGPVILWFGIRNLAMDHRSNQGKWIIEKKMEPVSHKATSEVERIRRRLAVQNMRIWNKIKLGSIPNFEFDVRIASSDPIE